MRLTRKSCPECHWLGQCWKDGWHIDPGRPKIAKTHLARGLSNSSESAWETILANHGHVPVPMESTYQATWNTCSDKLRLAVETGVIPEPDAE